MSKKETKINKTWTYDAYTVVELSDGMSFRYKTADIRDEADLLSKVKTSRAAYLSKFGQASKTVSVFKNLEGRSID